MHRTLQCINAPFIHRQSQPHSTNVACQMDLVLGYANDAKKDDQDTTDVAAL